ncbi:hypothetical protein GCM10023147_52090 [Tsukamurella soli]|uniref:Uncharacterized protein n=1 Tax=Tsukamurella soli TaxID=644556 RepID=A0ABP8KJJ0_9ACTN
MDGEQSGGTPDQSTFGRRPTSGWSEDPTYVFAPAPDTARTGIGPHPPGAGGPEPPTEWLPNAYGSPEPPTDLTPKAAVPGGPNRVLPPGGQAYSRALDVGSGDRDLFAPTHLRPIGPAGPGGPPPGVHPAGGFGDRPAGDAPDRHGYGHYPAGPPSGPKSTSKTVPVLAGVAVAAVVAAILVALAHYGVLGGGSATQAARAPDTVGAPATETPTLDPTAAAAAAVRSASVGDCAHVTSADRAVTGFTVVPCTDPGANYRVSARVSSSADCTTTWVRNSNPALTPADVVLCLVQR